ncbi:MAG: hypothetical protein ACQES0_06440 [Bacteroidota bacterium]
MRLLFLSFALVFSLTLSAQKDSTRYSGGMFYQYNNGSELNGSHGLGGMLRFYPVKNLYISGQGASYKADILFQKSPSYASLSYGGLSAGVYKYRERTRWSAGLFFGGGKQKSLIVTEISGDTITEAHLRKQTITLMSPEISLEYFITDKITFFAQYAYLLGFTKHDSAIRSHQVRLGVLFNR